MFRSFKLIIPLATALALSACAGTQLEQAQGLTPSGSDFQKNLYKGYVDLSASEYREADYRDSDTFALRAISAGSGEMVEPEALAARQIPEESAGDLSSARDRLTAALSAGAADRKPMEAAHAQVMFDCWMQEQEENFQPDDIARCRGELMAALAKLEEKPKVAAAPPPPPLPGPYVVFFDFDKAELTDEATAILAKAVADAQAAGDVKISTSGHTDRAGPDSYNDGLAKQRADAVMQYLIQSGVDKGKVLTSSHGETQPMMMTDDGKAEQKNRRVEIKLSR